MLGRGGFFALSANGMIAFSTTVSRSFQKAMSEPARSLSAALPFFICQKGLGLGRAFCSLDHAGPYGINVKAGGTRIDQRRIGPSQVKALLEAVTGRPPSLVRDRLDLDRGLKLPVASKRLAVTEEATPLGPVQGGIKGAMGGSLILGGRMGQGQ